MFGNDSVTDNGPSTYKKLLLETRDTRIWFSFFYSIKPHECHRVVMNVAEVVVVVG